MSELLAENLLTDTTEDGKIIVEPSYVRYIRSEGFLIESVSSVYSVESESRDMAHIVLKLKTYKKPKSDKSLDYAADGITIYVCDCWSFRESSNDVQDGKIPGGSCKHCEGVDKSLKAAQDDLQDTL